MANHDPKLSIIDDDVLESVNEAMIEIHERYHGRKPRSARTQMMGDDLLACLLADVYTDVEKTMIELERHTIVKETRSAFQHAMQERLIKEVQRLSGRRVNTFVSDSHVGPDLEIELFFLDPAD